MFANLHVRAKSSAHISLMVQLEKAKRSWRIVDYYDDDDEFSNPSVIAVRR